MKPERTSEIACILVRVRVAGRDWLLLRRHEKWGDWSIVGGHVEPDERSNWLRTAIREAEEELEPLRFGVDFALDPLSGGPSEWNEISRSAGGVPTLYKAQWFSLRFLQDASSALARLPADDFLLVETTRIESGDCPYGVSSVLERFHRHSARGLAGVPLAWEADLRGSSSGLLRAPTAELPSRAAGPAAANR